MKIVRVVSEHKSDRKKMTPSGQWDKPLYSSKKGFVEAIVDDHGQLVTRHLPKDEA